jgi:hypothetical protein
MADEKSTRKPAQPRGFVVELGTAKDVEAAAEIGAFAGLKTKGDLEAELAAYLGGEKILALFTLHLKTKAQERLNGLGPAPQLTKDGGLPILPPD